MMIEAGEGYLFTQMYPEGKLTWSGHVIEVDGNLIKVRGIDGDIILNTACISFESAMKKKVIDYTDIPDHLKPGNPPIT